MLFYFCIVVHNGAGHILLLDFLWTHSNSLDWPINSSGPNNVCNVWYIYMYVCMNIYLYKCKWKGSLLLLGWKNTHSWEHTLRLNLEEERKELIEPGFSHHYWIELLLEHQWRTKWLSITLIKVNISFIII